MTTQPTLAAPTAPPAVFGIGRHPAMQRLTTIVAATLLVHAANLLMNALEALLMRWRPPLQSMMET